MTLLSLPTMGCGQSIRKKSKHKADAVLSADNSYDNQSYGTAPSTGISKPSSVVVSSRSTELTDTKMTNKVLPAPQTLPPGGKTKSGSVSQSNGEARLGPDPDVITSTDDKVRRDSGTVKSPGLAVRSKMSASQLEFFKALDEKIEQGGDYRPESPVST